MGYYPIAPSHAYSHGHVNFHKIIQNSSTSLMSIMLSLSQLLTLVMSQFQKLWSFRGEEVQMLKIGFKILQFKWNLSKAVENALFMLALIQITI